MADLDKQDASAAPEWAADLAREIRQHVYAHTDQRPAGEAEGRGVMPMCLLIQWGPGKARFAMGKPVCPECGDEAEEILTFFGEVGYAHKIYRSQISRAAR